MELKKSMSFILAGIFVLLFSGIVSAVCDPLNLAQCLNATGCAAATGYWYNNVCNSASSNGCEYGDCDQCESTNCTGSACSWWTSDSTCHDKPSCANNSYFCIPEEVDCADLGGTAKADYECSDTDEVCCTIDVLSCDDLNGEVCERNATLLQNLLWKETVA